MKTKTIRPHLKKPDKEIGILRGLMPRDAQKDFSNSFKDLKSTFLSEKNLGRSKIYLLDPVELILGRTTHQSWVGVDIKKLIKACSGLDYIETYELYHFFSAQAVDVSKKLNIPLITEVWTSFLHPAYFLPPYSLNVKKVISQTSLFIARSERAKTSLLKFGVPERKIKVIYNGVDLKKFYPAKTKSKKTNSKTFLFVGELEVYKGVQTILDAWETYYPDHPNDNLYFVGKGSLSEKVQQNKNVKYLGYVKYNKLAEIYRMADIFISPSTDRFIGPFKWWEEFFSYTLMEAMASGLSIIASDSGGIPEEIGSQNKIVRQGNVQELVNTMENVNIKNTNRARAEKLFDLHKNTKILETEILKL